MSSYRLGVDVGGTHTDLVLTGGDGSDVHIEKVPSSPENPAVAVLAGLARLLERGIAPGDIDFFSHGTTVTTNALLEMKGARIGLLITRGFRAIQEVQSQARESNQFELMFRRPEPLVTQSLTREITGRVDYQGNEVTPIDIGEVRTAVRDLRKRGVSSFAVCYLFSFTNDKHERLTEQAIHEEFPEAFVSLSSVVLPRIREWPRLSTTLLNAYLEPVLSWYAGDLAQGLESAGVSTKSRFLMQSNGGVMPLDACAEGGRTVHTLLSGPAAGVRGCGYLLGVGQNLPHLVTMDMGGTSCDIAFIEDGDPLEVTEGEIAGRRLDVPALDISTISAGGGTIARVNAANHLVVGPDSAGASPGPVCYGKGGTSPTVTDADVVCGFLNPDHFLGGQQRLRGDLATEAIERTICAVMELTPKAAANGIVRLINARMADEIRVRAAKKSVNLRDHTLVPFGGAGPVHAAMVAEDLGIRRVLVPPNPGAFSALGLLCSDVVHDYVKSEICDFSDLSSEHAEACFVELEERAVVDLAAEGLGAAEPEFLRELDIRYGGQGYELRTPLEGLVTKPMSAHGLEDVVQRFHALHEAQHGHAARGSPVEIVSYRLRVKVAVPKQGTHVITRAAESTEFASVKREVSFDGIETLSATVLQRENLIPGDLIEGPAVVEQFDATTVVPPGWIATLDAFGNLVLDVQG